MSKSRYVALECVNHLAYMYVGGCIVELRLVLKFRIDLVINIPVSMKRRGRQ